MQKEYSILTEEHFIRERPKDTTRVFNNFNSHRTKIIIPELPPTLARPFGQLATTERDEKRIQTIFSTGENPSFGPSS